MANKLYVDLGTLKDYLGITGGQQDTLLATSLSAACRSIDKFCQRRFWLDDSPVARTFVPGDLLTVDLNASDEGPFGGDIGDASSVSVATDPSGSGVFNVAWASTDFELQPYNALTAYPEPRPYTRLRAVGTKTFPWLVNTWLTRLDRVRVTARWGWPEVPCDVSQATLIKAARLYHRKNSPQGVAGFGEFGVVRISQSDDPDVCMLLDDYRRWPVLVA